MPVECFRALWLKKGESSDDLAVLNGPLLFNFPVKLASATKVYKKNYLVCSLARFRLSRNLCLVVKSGFEDLDYQGMP